MDVPSEIILKIERYCAYQERCSFDVVRKLNVFNLEPQQVDEVVKYLIDNDFVNDERFTELFVRSKVRQSWGRQKIVAALVSKRIPKPLIDKSCSCIDRSEYDDKLKNAIQKWQRTHKDVERPREKLIRHLLSRGYLYEDIVKHIDLY